MEKTYKSFNQFNYSKKAITINYDSKKIYVYYGGACPIHYDKKTSTKAINEKIKELETAGFEIILKIS